MLRAFVATVGVLLIGSASTGIAAPCGGFTDVDDTNPATAPFCANVTWMKNRGITLGCPSTGAPRYCPNDPVSRLQMAAFMNRLGDVTFQQGGNAFGAVAKVGATDAFGTEILAGGKRAIRAEPNASSPRIISGFENNGAYAGVIGATIAGGGATGSNFGSLICPYAFGCQNSVTEHFGTVGGGLGNIVGEADGDLYNGAFGTVAGGVANSALFAGAVGGGNENQALGVYGVVAGGGANVVSGSFSAIGGGVQNRAGNMASFVAGGSSNEATGNYSFAAGVGANANADGCVVFANGNPTAADVTCGGPNRFVALAAGGYFLYSNASGAGVSLAPGASAFAPASDRAMKTGIDRVDIAQVLDRVVALPISTWRWKDEVSQSLHMGPMAQDFRAAFGLGDDEKRIVTVDADGVALAAIQGLNAKLEAEVVSLRAELAAIRSVLATVAADRLTQTAEIAP